ncbi:hypothetical protein PHMEG_00017019 [Phytophthora megakarya]|uniref:Uncharacterized protein n=1 Tax=Phytophthora megakarya TaxID=4795 RepID=A0A225VZX9_9STRA|nr:hypothetical protein PHMEG_00017019 [Phytophthora megakarya]
MAFCAGREDPRGWQDDGWIGSENEQEDALYDSLDEDELGEAGQDEPLANLFSMESVDAMQLNMVERLSWDASEDSSDEEGALPSMLPIQIDTTGDTVDKEWDLVSPCSETTSPRPTMMATLSPLTRVSISSPVRKLAFFEPEHEPTGGQITTKKVDAQQMIEEEEEEEEEVTPFNPEASWSPATNSVLSPPVTRSNPFPTYQPEEDRSATEIISGSDEENKKTSSGLPPNLLPLVPSVARWRRQKAPRTRSMSRSRNQSMDNDDDGDFSSDDEGYTPELHRRASEIDPVGASQWRRVRHTSMNFSSHRLSMNPTMMAKRLQEAKSKLNSGLHLLRSGSTASTVASEQSYLDSPACEEIKSAPAGVYREPSIFSDDSTSTSLISAASAYGFDTENEIEKHHPSRQQQLRAGVFKAAGLINAASAEAARKLKSRGFRAPHLPRQKAASETEEEDPEMSTPCP